MRRPCIFQLYILSSGKYTEWLPGWLLGWGSEFKELGDNVGQYVVGIVECDDEQHSVALPRAEHIRFTTKLSTAERIDEIMPTFDRIISDLKTAVEAEKAVLQ